MKYLSTAALALALVACSKNIDTMDAVKQGVLRDIPKDINLSAMDVSVVSVSFRGKEADAVVAFAPKGGAPMMNMKYTMERKGDEWHIKARAAGAIEQHAAQPDPGQAGAAPQGLPPGHPTTGGAGAPPPVNGEGMPAGHPSLDGSPAPNGKK
ncbi:MAG TPA: hypothetical protein VNH18_03630 [Bryobacteraceae bacterium]|nr:hypothetical protein [Bryobacteraceae bacterium]